ncbi:MAG: UvrD-helicase domain-containing protein [Endomicrobia bacterium]|nr:UvrD-helicase domain-containing protein [Endomicrobiia bacterium]
MNGELTVVSASAGTGKTTKLTFYFLKKLVDEIQKNENNGKQLSLFQLAEILNKFVAITFTNAAANQLKDKIMQVLRNPSELKVEQHSDEEKQRIQEVFSKYTQILNQLPLLRQLRISTIHSFCIDIVRALHSELHLSVDIDFSEDEDLWETAIELYFHSVTDKNIKKFISYIGYNKLKHILSIVGKKYYFFVNTFGTISTNLNPEKINWPTFEDIVGILNFENTSWKDEHEKIRQKHSFRRKKESEIDENVYNNFYELLNSTFNSELLTKIINAFSFIILQVGQWYEEMIRYKAIGDYDGILFLVAKYFKNKKTEEVLKLLEEKGIGIKYLFVDEAQDNSFLQYFIIDKLVNYKDPKIYCFIVGDLKQSIYHWREAYPEFFKKLIELVKQMEKVSTQHKYILSSTSYRISNRQLLDEINGYTSKWKSKGWDFYDTNLEINLINSDIRMNSNLSNLTAMTNIKRDSVNTSLEPDSNKNTLQWLKNIKNYTIGVVGRSRNSCKKIREYLDRALEKTDLDNKILFRDRAGFDIRNEKELLWFKTILDLRLKTRPIDMLKLIALLDIEDIVKDIEIEKVEQEKNASEMSKNVSDEDVNKKKDSEQYINKLLLLLLTKKNEVLNLLKDINDKIGEKISLQYFNTKKTITQSLGSFILQECTKNKIFDFQEHRNLLHFLSNLYRVEKKTDTYNPYSYFSVVDDIFKYEVYDTPDVWGQPQKGVVEITTIHSAKGLEYDIVCLNYKDINDLTKNDIDGNRLGYEVYPFEILLENNNIELLWLPVNLKKLIMNKNVRKTLLNYWGSDNYIIKTLKKYIHSNIQENFNLAYVLVTRAKQKIVKY